MTILFTSSYILDYSVLIILLYRFLPIIDNIVDFIGQKIIDLFIILGQIIINISKMIIRFGLYYLVAILYVLWFGLIINIMISLYKFKYNESITISKLLIEEKNNFIKKIDNIIFSNYN